MLQVTGRVSTDAVIRTLPSGQQVVSFNVADNHDYKRQGTNEWVKSRTYFSCTYFRSTNIANVLRQGAVVQVQGIIKPRTYKTRTGQEATALNLTANSIDFLQYAPKTEEQAGPAAETPQVSEAPKKQSSRKGKATGKQQSEAAAPAEQKDDLPF